MIAAGLPTAINRLMGLAVVVALLAACAAEPGADSSTSVIASPTPAESDITGVINLDRYRVPDNACLSYASVEGMLVGDAVEVLGAEGSSLGSSTLMATDPDDPQSCALSFEIDDVQPSESYTFVVSGRTSRLFSYADLADTGWTVDLSPDSGAYPEPVEEISANVLLTVSQPISVELTGAGTCRISVDARYPDRGLTTISLDATSLGTSGDQALSLTATLKFVPGFPSYATIDVLIDGDLAYRVAPQMVTGAGVDTDERGGEVSVAGVLFSGTGAPLGGAPGALAGKLEWSCGEGIAADEAVGEVSIGPPFDIRADIDAGRCDPPVTDWQPMWLPFRAELAFGSMTGEINRMFPTLLEVQLDVPNFGDQRLLISEFEWSGEPAKITATGTRYEATATLDFGVVNGTDMDDVSFEAWWLCPSN